MEGTISYAGNLNATMAGTMVGGPQQGAAMPQASEEEMLQYIVEEVNKLLKKTYSLVDFDELEPMQLLQCLSDIFETLSREAWVDFNEVPGEAGAAKLSQFLLKTLNYKIPSFIAHNFDGGFCNGDKTILYPVFYWVLKHMPQNSKRVYLARYLTRVDIPEDQRMADDGLRDLYQHYESLRADFIQTHKRVDALREAHADPTEARRKINDKEKERDKLKQYISNAEAKLNSNTDKEALLAACKQYRLELEESNKRSEKYAELQQSLYSAQKRQAEIHQRHQNLRRDMQDARVSTITNRLNDEIATNKMKIEEQLPRELNEKRAENAALNKLANDPLDISSLHAEMQGLDAEISELSRKVAERQRPGEDGTTSVQMMKQQVQRVTKRKNEILAELHTLQGENNRLLEELRRHEQSIDQFKNSKMLKGEDYRKFANQVRTKTTATKTMKARMGELRAEFGVLSYTQQQLQAKHDDMQADIDAVEKQMGITGYVQTSENLQKVAQQKNEVEQVKGKTLEELSRVVQEFAISIRERRGKLAPQIVELRNQRQAAMEVEMEWSDKKQQYEHQEGLLMQDVNKLEVEVGSLSEENKLNEALFHRLKAQSVLLDAQLKRAEEEKVPKEGVPSLADQMQRKTQELEARQKELQRKRRDIEDNHDTNLQQVEWFNALKKILDAKVRSLHAPQPGQGGVSDAEINNVMQANTGTHQQGADVLAL